MFRPDSAGNSDQPGGLFMVDPINEYIAIAIAAAIALGIAGGLVFLNAILGPRRRSTVKDQPFECGNPPLLHERGRFSVKFYLVALFFLVFDVEVVFILPWAVRYRALLADPVLGMLALVEVLIFIAVLTFGLLYVWKRKALDWE